MNKRVANKRVTNDSSSLQSGWEHYDNEQVVN